MKDIFKELEERTKPDGTIDFPVVIPGEATFLTFFANLAPLSVMDDDKIFETESELGSLVLKNPRFSAFTGYGDRLWLEASFSVPLVGRWTDYPFLAGASGKLAGEVDVHPGFCAFSLTAVPDGVSIPGTAGISLLLSNRDSFPERRSAATLEIKLSLPNLPAPVAFTTGLFLGTTYWWLQTRFENGLGAFDVVNFFAALFGVQGGGLLLPPNSPVNNFKLYRMDFGMDYNGSLGLSPQYIGAYLATAEPWTLPLRFLTVDDLRLMWEIQWGREEPSSHLLTGQIFAAMTLALPGGLRLSLSGRAYLPDMKIEAQLRLSESKTVGEMMGAAASALPDSRAASILLAAVDLYANCKQRELSVSAELKAGSVLRFSLGSLEISLARLYAAAHFTQAGNKFLLGGEIDFGVDTDSFSLALEGSYTSPESSNPYWAFHGWLSRGEVRLGALIRRMLNIDPGSGSQFDVVLSEFDISYETLNKSFSLTAAFHGEWGRLPDGLDVEAIGKICLMSVQGKNTLSVMLALKIPPFSASVQIDDFPENPAYRFRFAYREMAISAQYRDQVLSASLENVSLGDVIAFLVELVNPNRTVKFPPPWDFLNKIDLSFALAYDFKTRSLTLTCPLSMNIAGLFRLEGIGLTFTADSKVLMRLDTGGSGQFGKAYEWDVLESNTPGLANTQNKFKLHYLAMAQHFSDRGGKLPAMNAIKEAVEYLSAESESLVYSDGANWLFAADFTINDVFRARAILLDPHLYGIAITVDGKKPPFDSFDGLMLELLYKKISRDVGMFRATLVLPQKFRRFTVGYATLTIGRMSLEIYTNGDFKIDMGFPHNRDFSQSFALEFGIFSGSGGFYFGLLSGLTCPGLPAASGGYYAPVIQLGIGLSIGIGRSFDIGIVSAGFSLQAVGIFEGIMAFYNESPHAVTAVESLDRNDIEPAYFKAKALLGITGRVYVKVDLCVVTLSATVAFNAFAQVSFETGKPTVIDLDLELTLQATVKILFIKVHFEYSLKLHKQIEISGSNDKRLSANNLCRYLSGWTLTLALDILPYFSLSEKGAGHEHVLAFLPVMSKADFARLAALLTDWIKSSPVSGDTDYETISRFLSDNVRICLQIRPQSDNEDEGVIFAMPAPLALRVADGKGIELARREYWKDNLISDAYIARIREYFSAFDPEDGTDSPALGWNGEKPVAEVIFTDYFNMLLRHISKVVKEDGENTVDFDGLAAMVSRFMLQGLRLPEAEGSGTRALYDLTGQQISYVYDDSGIIIEARRGQVGVSWLEGDCSAQFTGEQIAGLLPPLSFKWTERFSIRPMPPFALSPKLCSVREQIALEDKVLYRINGDITSFRSPFMRLDESGETVDCLFGALLPVDIRRTGHPDIFRVMGLEAADRRKLIPVFREGKPYKLLYAPAPMDGKADVFCDIKAGKDDRFIRQNLSRETHMLAADGFGEPPLYVTDLSGADFLRLLWRCSVVCGGYNLFLKPGDVPRIPGNIFDEEGKAKLWIFAGTEDKSVINCARSVSAADCGRSATLHDAQAGEYRPVLPPGCFGAEAALDDSGLDGGFSVLGYEGGAAQSRPLVPVKNGSGGGWHYAPVWPLHKLAGSQNPYDAKPAEFAFRLRDILGNFAAGSVGYTVSPCVSDFVVGAHEWPGTRLTWQAAKPAKIKVTLSCTPLKNPANNDSLDTIQRAIWQTGQPGCRITAEGQELGQVKAYLKQLLEHMKNPGENLPPEEISVLFTPTLKAVTALNFSLIIRRDTDSDIEKARQAVTSISPHVTKELSAFAGEFEAAFPGYKLARTGEEPERLYAVRTGEGGLSLSVSPYERDGQLLPVYYAFRPLCNTPITRECRVTTWEGGSELRVFANVDMEVWARHILEDIDMLLSSSLVTATASSPALSRLIGIKELLAENISRQLIPIEAGTNSQAALVQAWVLEHLRLSLSEGYGISSVAQYRSRLTVADESSARMTLNAKGDGEVSALMGKADTMQGILCVGYRFASRYRTGIFPKFEVKAENLELDIENVEDGYQSSRWLQLIKPLETAAASFASDLPIPNPLRQIPEKTELISHAFSAGERNPHWNYHLKIKAEAAQQDVLSVEVLFEYRETKWSLKDNSDFFSVMAGYETARLPLLSAMATDAGKYLPVFNDYAEAVATRWGEKISVDSLSTNAEALNFDVSMTFEDGALKLRIDGYDPVKWTVETIPASMEIEPGQPFEFEVVIKNLSIYSKNVATPKLRSTRNSRLLGDLTVDEAFIYKTEEVMLPGLYAHVERDGIDCGTVDGVSLQSLLKAQALIAGSLGFENPGCKADIVVRYQYGFGESTMRLPVCMFVDRALNAFSQDEEIAAAFLDWYAKTKPVREKSGLELEVKISTGSRSLARFSRVRVRLREA